MMTLMKSEKGLLKAQMPSAGNQVPQNSPPNNRPIRVKRSPWLISTSKINSGGTTKTNRPSGIGHIAPAQTSTSTEKLPDLKYAHETPPHKDKKTLGTRFSDPGKTNNISNPSNIKSNPEYVPKLTKYRLEHPDRFAKLASKSSKPRKRREDRDDNKGHYLLKSGSRGPGGAEGAKWHHMAQEYGLQQAMRESKLLQMSASNSHLASSPKCSHNKSSTNLNVTLMDIANLTPKAFDRSQPPNISDLLFNTYIDVQRFRKLLRDTDEEKTRSLTTNIVERVNYCGEEKTKRIDAWLDDVENVRSTEGLEAKTVEDDILYEDYTKNASKSIKAQEAD